MDSIQTIAVSETRSVDFGSGTTARLNLLDQEEEIELASHDGGVNKVIPLGWPQVEFITVGDDNRICAWSRNGILRCKMDGHASEVLRIWTKYWEYIVISLSRDNTLRIWDLRTGEETVSIPTSVPNAENILLSNTDAICFVEQQGTRIMNFSGEEIVNLKQQTEQINHCLRLHSGRWLTVRPGQHRLWSASGVLLHNFPNGFSLENGYMELSDGGFMAVDEMDNLIVTTVSGAVRARQASDPEAAKVAKNFFKSRNDAIARIRNPDVSVHPHHKNPIDPTTHFANEELEKLELSSEAEQRQRFMWEFFNRPNFDSLRTAFRRELNRSRACEEAMEERIWHQQQTLRNAWVGFCFPLTLLAGAGGVFYYWWTNNGWQETIGIIEAYRFGESFGSSFYVEAVKRLVWPVGIITSALWGLFQIRKRLKIRKQVEEGVKALKTIKPEVNYFASEIKDFRREVISQAPVMNDLSMYSGKKVSETIENVINNNLEKIAMDACGITREEIVFKDQESIKLRDWALIQDIPEHTRKKLSEHNLGSFWWTPEGEIIFAVQFIQFIFLTQDKLDVFTTFYDFITEKAVQKEAHAFYYRDVTNISKRDVDRKGTVKEFEATEIVLAVSSGKQIQLVVLNEGSVATLLDHVLEDEERNVHIRELKAKLAVTESNKTLSPADKEFEIRSIQVDLADLESRQGTGTTVSFNNKADEAIENIRRQVRDHKTNMQDA